jgi:hypothetical protein
MSIPGRDSTAATLVEAGFVVVRAGDLHALMARETQARIELDLLLYATAARLAGSRVSGPVAGKLP